MGESEWGRTHRLHAPELCFVRTAPPPPPPPSPRALLDVSLLPRPALLTQSAKLRTLDAWLRRVGLNLRRWFPSAPPQHADKAPAAAPVPPEVMSTQIEAFRKALDHKAYSALEADLESACGVTVPSAKLMLQSLAFDLLSGSLIPSIRPVCARTMALVGARWCQYQCGRSNCPGNHFVELPGGGLQMKIIHHKVNLSVYGVGRAPTTWKGCPPSYSTEPPQPHSLAFAFSGS